MFLKDEIGNCSLVEFKVRDGILNWKIFIISVEIIKFGLIIIEIGSIYHLISGLFLIGYFVVNF